MLICSDNPFRDIVVLGLDAPETTFFYESRRITK